MRITAIRRDRMRLPLDPPFYAAYDPPGWTEERRDFFLAEPVRIDADGCLTVPAAPGLGAQIDRAAVARYARST